MSQVLYINETRRDEIIAEAALKQTPVVLTRRSRAGWRTAKARFQGLDRQDRTLFVEHPTEVDGRTWPTPVPGELFGITFRRGHKKCLFNAVVVDAGEHSTGNATQPGFAVRWPADVQELQRRVYQRACPPAGRRLKARVVPGGTQTDEQRAFNGVIEDLSAGGMRIRCPNDPDLETGEAATIAFALGPHRSELTVDGTFRHSEATADSEWSLGFQFVGLETSPEGQELLVRIARIVTDFQRAAARRSQPRLRSRRHNR